MSSESDEITSLVESLRNGDNKVLAELFSLYRNQLRRMVSVRMDYRMKGRLDESDVLQEAYIDAEKRVEHFLKSDDVPFIVWLRQITTQTMINLYRRHLGTQRRDAARELSTRKKFSQNATSYALADQLVDNLTSPSHKAMRTELLEEVHKALDSMEPIDQEILTLRHFEELGNKETAEILGIQQATASIRYIRALKRLKQVLSSILPDYTDM